MIRFDDVSFTYSEADRPTLHRVTFDVPEGELCVVVGETGTGKSTLLRAINGLVPHFSGGLLAGTVTVDGRTTKDNRPRDLADVVGFVGQNPLATFVTETVEDELAYTMENLGVPSDAMRRRVEDAVDLLGLQDLRDRSLRALSGGQQQRVAIGAVLTASPRLLVLDEPTSALDPAAAEEVLATLARLVHDLGLTVVMAEHRLERVVPFADRIVLVPGDGAPLVEGPPQVIMRSSSVAPPLVELGRLVGWDPLPLSVRDARRLATPLRERLAALTPPRPEDGAQRHSRRRRGGRDAQAECRVRTGRRARWRRPLGVPGRGPRPHGQERLWQVDAAQHDVGSTSADPWHRGGRRTGPPLLPLRRIDSSRGTGASGPGTPPLRRKRPGRVPNRRQGVGPGRGDDRCAPSSGSSPVCPAIAIPATSPRDNGWPWPWRSCWRRHRRSCCSTSRPGGWTTPARTASLRSCGSWPKTGTPIVLATHDVELAARIADRAVVLADGQVIADGPARQVVCHSPVFAPQVAKVLAPEEWLTVDEVRRALSGAVSA